MNSILKVLASLGLTVGLSTLIALFFSSELFWLVWSTATILQFVAFYFYNRIYTNRLIKDLENIKIQQLKEANRNMVQVKCPCDETIQQSIDFRFDQVNTFDCIKCGKSVKCDINVPTVMVTEPIYFKDK